MSPPCQPFTRVGKKQDNKDKRTNSFFIVLDRISKLLKTYSRKKFQLLSIAINLRNRNAIVNRCRFKVK